MPPDEPKAMHPTTPERLADRQKSLAKEQQRLDESPALPRILLPCGCKVEQFNHHGIKVHYCARHVTHLFSPRFDGTDVIYFVTEGQRP